MSNGPAAGFEDDARVARWREICLHIDRAARESDRAPAEVELVCVSKTYDADHIKPLLMAGQRLFGENRVQEAQGKWPDMRRSYPDLELHLIGPLQSNKAGEAVELFYHPRPGETVW